MEELDVSNRLQSALAPRCPHTTMTQMLVAAAVGESLAPELYGAGAPLVTRLLRLPLPTTNVVIAVHFLFSP